MSDFDDSLILGGADSRGSDRSAASDGILGGLTFADGSDGPVAAPDSPPMASARSDQHTDPMVTIAQLQATLATKLMTMDRGNLTTEMLWAAFWPQQSHADALLERKDYDNLILTYSAKITAVDAACAVVATDTASVADTAAVTAPVRGDSSNREVRSEPPGPSPSPTQVPLKRKPNRIRLTLEARIYLRGYLCLVSKLLEM